VVGVAVGNQVVAVGGGYRVVTLGNGNGGWEPSCDGR
jgi:hypothetical protein